MFHSSHDEQNQPPKEPFEPPVESSVVTSTTRHHRVPLTTRTKAPPIPNRIFCHNSSCCKVDEHVAKPIILVSSLYVTSTSMATGPTKSDLQRLSELAPLHISDRLPKNMNLKRASDSCKGNSSKNGSYAGQSSGSVAPKTVPMLVKVLVQAY